MTQVKRQLLHRRRIESYGFLRDDGLWEVEATMQDLKAQDVYRDYDGSLVPKDSPFHDMYVRLTLDDSFLIKDIEVSMDAFPFPGCGGAVPAFDVIKGTRIGAGWNRWLKQTFAGKSGCTHIMELLPVAATTAFQTMWQPLSEKYPQQVPIAIGKLVNTCQGWADDGPMVRKLVDEQVLTLPNEEHQS